jgi:hypothetical protein
MDNMFIEIDPKNYVIDMDLDRNRCVLPLELLNTQNYQSATYVFGTPFFRQRCLLWDMKKNQLSVYEKRG